MGMALGFDGHVRLYKKWKERQRHRKYRAKNRDKVREHDREYYAKNRDKIRKHKNEYYAKNRDKMRQHDREYYAKNRDKVREHKNEYYAKNRDKIRKHDREYRAKNRDKIKQYYKEYDKERYAKNPDKERQRAKTYRLKNPDKIKEAAKKRSQYERIIALKLIQSKIECVRCGCTDMRFLEINHKNGGGGDEYRSGLRLTRAVYNGKRKTDDLEILCRPCNNIHFLEMKYKEKIPLKVTWLP